MYVIGVVLSILHVSCALILIVFPKCWYYSSSGVGVWGRRLCYVYCDIHSYYFNSSDGKMGYTYSQVLSGRLSGILVRFRAMFYISFQFFIFKRPGAPTRHMLCLWAAPWVLWHVQLSSPERWPFSHPWDLWEMIAEKRRETDGTD